MKFRMLILAALVMVFAATSFGQTNANFLWAEGFNPYWTPLTYCDTGDYAGVILAEGTTCILYKDSNPFDPANPLVDAPVTVGHNGGASEIWPTNEILFDTPTGSDAPGFYATSYLFEGGSPGTFDFFYIVVCCDDPATPEEECVPMFYSSRFGIPVGYQEIMVGGPDPATGATGFIRLDCCTPPGPDCTPSDPWVWFPGGAGYHSADVDYYPENLYFCVDVCAGMDFVMTVEGNYEWEVPAVNLMEGCDPQFTGCDDPECTPAVFTWDGVWIYEGGNHVSVITVLEDGCICIELDDILPVELSNFDAVAGDKEVALNWSTASETDIDGFEIVRDNVVVHRTDAGEGNYNWIDSDLTNGRTYSYELVSIAITGDRVVIGDAEATPSFNAATITEYALHQNFPNPFNPTTSIVFDVVESNHVTLTVYNAMGQEVSTLVNGIFENGRHNVEFSSDNLTSGLYFYNVKIGNEFTATKKMLLVK